MKEMMTWMTSIDSNISLKSSKYLFMEGEDIIL
jgi:hypothetical protein